MEPMKVYVVKKSFEKDGLSYTEGVKYELSDSAVAALPEGSVEEFVPEPPTSNGDTSVNEGTSKPATPWAGNHTVGRE